MENKILKYLSDIRDAVSAILKFVEGKTYEDYREDDLLISGFAQSHQNSHGYKPSKSHALPLSL